MQIPQRKTSRLILRPFDPGDALSLHWIMGQPDMLRYFPNTAAPDMDRVKRLITFQLRHWQKFGYGWWALQDRESSSFVGWSGLQFLPETDEVEIAYLLDKEHWGQGLATEAARSGLDYGFRELKLTEIVGIVHPENNASIRVIEKLGMSFTERKPYFGMDCLRYSLKTDDFSGKGLSES